MMSFEVKGGYEGGKRVMDRVKIFLRAASLGDTRSLIVHSASTSHRAVPRNSERPSASPTAWCASRWESKPSRT